MVRLVVLLGLDNILVQIGWLCVSSDLCDSVLGTCRGISLKTNMDRITRTLTRGLWDVDNMRAGRGTGGVYEHI